MPAESDLVRDAASLLRFIRSVCFRKEDLDRTHRQSTGTFFDYLANLESATDQYLQRLVAKEPNPITLFASLDRENLLNLRLFWNRLHEFAKPVRDADTLHAPAVLIDHLEKSLTRLRDLSRARLLVYHTPRLNYLQYPRGQLREDGGRYANMLRKLVRRGRVPKFPDQLALVAIPYSQDSVLFSNPLLCHELGHFVFEEFAISHVLAPYYKNSLKAILGTKAPALHMSWCTNRLASWAEEIFCDRFAIALMGPAAAFSYIELFDLIGSTSAQEVEFYHDHPADACRFHEQFEQLQAGGWWDLLRQHDTKYSELVRRLHAIRDTRYTYNAKPRRLAVASLRAFRLLLPIIEKLIRKIFDKQEATFRDTPDSSCVEAIHEYLKRGVVPATLVKDRKQYRPDPVLLINAAYLFYLRNVPDLISRIKDGKPSDINHRAFWGERIEQWTLKAMEDLSLPSAMPRWGS